jgi:anti-sigma factor RsiW
VIHARARRLLDAYLDGSLDIELRARVDSHLAECAACAREARELKQTAAMLRDLPLAEAPPGLADAVMARIAAGEGRPPRWVGAFRRSDPSGGGWALAAGLAALLIVVSLEPVPLPDRPGEGPVRVAAPTFAPWPESYGPPGRPAACAGPVTPLPATRPAGRLDDEVEQLLTVSDAESLIRLMLHPPRQLHGVEPVEARATAASADRVPGAAREGRRR